MGGSTNTILHTLAIAREAGIPYDIARIDQISRRVPCLCKVSPSSDYHVQDVHRAGGIHTILGELKRMNALTLTCKTVTGKSIGENIDEWDIRSPKCADWTKVARISGSSAIVVDPNDKMGHAARTASGNLAPKPMLFHPGDERAITLWRDAAAWNGGDIAAQLALYSKKVSVKMPGGAVLKGHDQLRPVIEAQLRDSEGLVRAELAEYREEPVLLFWQYAKTGERSRLAMVRAKKLKNWVITRAEFDNDPKHLA